MKTENFELIKELVESNDLQKASQLLPDEFNINSNRLDHIEIEENKITFHDRGCDFGSGVIDLTFSIGR